MSDNNVVFLYFGNNDTVYTQERLEHYKREFPGSGWTVVCISQNYWGKVTINKWYCSKKITAMSQGQMVHFVEIQNDVKRLANLVARMENACVEVTWGFRR